MHASAADLPSTPQSPAGHQAGPTVAEQWAAFVHGTRVDTLPAAVVELAKSRLLDSLGTALAARDLPVPAVALRFVRGQTGPASVIGHPERLPAVDAAFVNATLVNGCTHDDFLAKSHPGAVVVPAALAVGEAHGGSGRDLLAAVVAGYELVARAYHGAPAMLPQFRATGVAGVIGAAAAAGRMLGLPAPQLVHALGCAAMFASGFGEGFRTGTMDVKLNVGWASRSGVSAAGLAAAGATASPLAFEGESGYFRAFGASAGDAPQAVRELGSRYLIEDVVYKERPVCIFVQTPVHLALSLRASHALVPAQIERVSVRAPWLTLTNPGYTNTAPFQTPLKARISARFTVAAALLGRPVDEYAWYDNVDDPEVLALCERIELLEPAADQGGRVDLEVLCAGRSYGLSGLEMDSLAPTLEKTVAKFRRLTAHLPGGRGEQVLRTILAIEDLDSLGELASLLHAD